MAALVRFASHLGAELGVLDEGLVTPSGLSDAHLPTTLQRGEEMLDIPTARRPVPVENVVLLPPILESSRIFCVAQNYPAHAAEAGGASPPTPIVFLKPPQAFVGHGGAATLPRESQFFDYEGEVAVVIGRTAAAVPPSAAAEVIAGYTIANDGSARDLQPATLADRFQVDWFAAKSFDGGSALGPGVVRAADVPPFEDLRLQTWHNQELVQDDVLASMYHSVPELISFVSRIVCLRPGDVILTGTPAGVGKARGVCLEVGDVVAVSATGLGELVTHYAGGAESPDDPADGTAEVWTVRTTH
jgi:2-keto-4-pentenoate hydratase/2-oxohepta-3-ene-1,7-dioic acid hydratase in catechol pathway